MARVQPGAGGVTVALEAQEAGVLRDLLDQLRALLDEDPGADDVLERLFPRAYDDDEDEADYRDLVRDSLSSEKREALDAMVADVGDGGPVDVTLSLQRAERWLVGLTDMRLALGTRLGVTEERMNVELDVDDPDAPGLALLHWLGWIQGAIVDAMPPLA